MEKYEVVAPLVEFYNNQLPCILMGMRLAAATETFPEPTDEERNLQWTLTFIQGIKFHQSKKRYVNWLLLRGFEDIHKAICEALRCMLKYGVSQCSNSDHDKQIKKIWQLKFPELVQEVQNTFSVFTNKVELYALNTVRNALVHDNGFVTEARSNNANNTKLILEGIRPVLFFQKGNSKVPVILGSPGPIGFDLMMGAEKFQIEFDIGAKIELCLKEFIDMVWTGIFIKSEIDTMLNLVTSNKS